MHSVLDRRDTNPIQEIEQLTYVKQLSFDNIMKAQFNSLIKFNVTQNENPSQIEESFNKQHDSKILSLFNIPIAIAEQVQTGDSDLPNKVLHGILFHNLNEVEEICGLLKGVKNTSFYQNKGKKIQIEVYLSPRAGHSTKQAKKVKK